jgi:DNA-binding transcriptional ArsR family regulator
MTEDSHEKASKRREDVSDVYDVLTHRRRRMVLYELDDRDGPVSLSTLVDALVEWERTDDEPPPVEEVRATLLSEHLPKMERAELVEYEPETQRVSFLPNGVRARQLRSLAITQARR